MKSSNYNDVYELIKSFQDSTIARKPSYQSMVHEVLLMNFKIRSITGNITSLDIHNETLIDALWCLGKLDEFARKGSQSVKPDDQDAFFRFVNEMRGTFQHQLNTAYLVRGESQGAEPSIFEAEIYKDSGSQVN